MYVFELANIFASLAHDVPAVLAYPAQVLAPLMLLSVLEIAPRTHCQQARVGGVRGLGVGAACTSEAHAWMRTRPLSLGGKGGSAMQSRGGGSGRTQPKKKVLISVGPTDGSWMVYVYCPNFPHQHTQYAVKPHLRRDNSAVHPSGGARALHAVPIAALSAQRNFERAGATVDSRAGAHLTRSRR